MVVIKSSKKDKPSPDIEDTEALSSEHLIGWLHADMKAFGTITPERWNAAVRSAKESFARQEEVKCRQK